MREQTQNLLMLTLKYTDTAQFARKLDHREEKKRYSTMNRLHVTV